ncbi:HflK protein [Afipia carboxidovorans OM5]|uniref:Protein HflK n=1 Tax=Afipia carboxidovorans (strain ATCC 49405 / DSM 1227 / KCTC 32145 / OM5) TaxID=504832 RepID=B6JB69_AFIC5|nr:FtsH protease activity modulator HflK [Afipia carboxidovorans]ACI92410.1 HflK protein [Afipia carboxidovorans OM5]AEI03811.1 protein HflK [Afipia carboxidovorans OM4]AEI07388.1 protein HflK [Afipia carboxidovorans OM5]BEV44921.1 FtsH protease activity modulator HflK [Afipia carboxidovorans]
MAWKNQGGSPWGPGPKGPWGSGPQSQGPKPSDLEDLLRRSQDRIQQMMPGGHMSGMGIALLVVAGIAIWGLSGFFRVQPDELGAVLRFGKHVRTVQPGLNYHMPYPIETVLLPKALRVSTLNIGMTVSDDSGRRGRVVRDVPEESLMLTGDENIVDVDFTVLWRIAPDGVGNFLFNIQNPEGTVKAVAESAMREVIGRSDIQPILTGARNTVEAAVHQLMQKTLDGYGAGIMIQQVQLQKVDPPQQVIDAFRDVQAARADLERLQNEAQTYANRVIPDARGRAAQVLQQAQGYKEQTIAEAKGQAARFLSVFDEYKKAPDVTRQRIYLETMEHVLGPAEKIVLDSGGAGGQGVVPYLPLNELGRKAPAAPGQQQSGASR